jgi:hypothetical protein
VQEVEDARLRTAVRPEISHVSRILGAAADDDGQRGLEASASPRRRQRWEILYDRGMDTLRARDDAERRRRVEDSRREDAAIADCTFQPSISDASRALIGPSNVPVHTRLYESGVLTDALLAAVANAREHGETVADVEELLEALTGHEGGYEALSAGWNALEGDVAAASENGSELSTGGEYEAEEVVVATTPEPPVEVHEEEEEEQEDEDRESVGTELQYWAEQALRESEHGGGLFVGSEQDDEGAYDDGARRGAGDGVDDTEHDDSGGEDGGGLFLE